MIGKTISHYKILDKLGEGGMGVVYRAKDTKLGREVALKTLPEEYARDADLITRSRREAKLLASLNHPNIAAIYGLEEEEDARFLVLELVVGETLAERLFRGALSVEEALEICMQIAEALEAAHEKGIIHRDLKPGNIKITPESKVKVLDFGLAKAFEEAGSGERPGVDLSKSPTLSLDSSKSGVILGTAPYMSPEQARGKPLDKRTDIWSFGCVLFELLTSKRAFEGETVTDTVAAILKGEPDWEALPEETPWNIRTLLRRCLQKDPHLRIHDIADARIDIEETLNTPLDASAMPGEAQAVPSLWKRTIPWGVAGLMAAVAVFALWSLWNMISPEPPTLKRFSISLPSAYERGFGPTMALSSDGQHFVYVGRQGERQEIYYRAIDQTEAVPIEGTEGARRLFFSPDGDWVGFHSDGKLKKVSLRGGSPLTICDVTDIHGASWGVDGNIIFGSLALGLFRVSAAGGTPQSITTSDQEKGETGHLWPQILPDDKAVLFTIWTTIGTGYDEARIGVLSLETGQWKTVLEGGSYPRYSPTGHLLYVHSETLMAVLFDLTKLDVMGDPIPVLEGVPVNTFGVAHFAFSRDGMLVHWPATEADDLSLLWVDRQGVIQTMTETRRGYEGPSFSPDGESLALTVYDGQNYNVWIYEIARGILTPYTFEKNNSWAIWTPDGKRVTFSSNRNGQFNLFWMPTDGSSEAEQLTVSQNRQLSTSWSPDGKVLAFQERDPETGWDILMLPLDGERKPQPFLATQFNQRHAMFSPLGQWIAFTSNRSGRDEVYAKRYPSEGAIVPISSGGGSQPLWAPNGKELFYRIGDKMMVVSIQMEPTFKAGPPKLLFEGSSFDSYTSADLFTNYDIHPDSQRFVMIRRAEERQAHFNVVLNWFEELKRLVPSGK